MYKRQVLSALGFTEPVNFSLSAWITEVGGSQSGWGYSIFAEAYYDFGYLGWIFLAVWGYFYAVSYTHLDVYKRQRCLCTVRTGAEIKIGSMSSLNSDCKIVSHEKIEIGHDTIFGPNVLIYDHDHVYNTETGVRRKDFKTSAIVIGNNCWIGAGSIILRGTHIGDNCLVGAGSIVKGNYPAGTKIIQKRGGIQ